MTDATEYEQLLEFFYQCPVGLIAFDDRGQIDQVNPAAANLLIDGFGPPSLDGLDECLGDVWHGLRARVDAHPLPGPIVTDELISAANDTVVALTIVRISRDRNLMVIADATERHEGERQRDELLASTQEARHRLETLERNATNLAAASRTDDVAAVVLSELSSSLGLDLSSLGIARGDDIEIIHGRGLPDDLAETFDRVSLDAAIPIALSIEQDETIRVDSFDEITQRFPDLGLDHDIHPIESLVAIPLRSADKEPIGSLVVTAPAPDWFRDDAMTLLNGLAGQTGLALERSLLFERAIAAGDAERDVAARLQRALLPDRPLNAGGLTIVPRFNAASDLLTVGGDWYDSFSWASGEIAVLVGDVVGHDVEAAATMGRVRAALAATIPYVDPSPAAVLRELDRIAHTSGGADFATAACILVDPRRAEIRYATAGHPPPLVVDAEGSTRWLTDAISPPIGVIDGAERLEATTSLHPGTTIVMYSDGLIERRDESLDVSMERLAATVSTLVSLGPHALADRLLTDRLESEVPFDDVIAVVMRWQPET